MNLQQRKRERALQLLERISAALSAGRPFPEIARRYMLEVCEAALAGKDDPLQIARSVGQQPAATLSIARCVHEIRRRDGTLSLDAATVQAAQELKASGIDATGGTGGTAEKHYLKHRHQLVARDELYASINAGGPTEASVAPLVEQILKPPTR